MAEVWFADALAALPDDPRPRLRSDLSRCARETGWVPGEREDRERPYVVHQTVNWREPRSGTPVQMRVSLFAPVLALVAPSPAGGEWGRAYLDIPGLTRWWQEAGWLVPDAGWLNSPFSRTELIGLNPADARELRRWHTLSRGDALFFEW